MTATDWFALDMMGEIDVLLKLIEGVEQCTKN